MTSQLILLSPLIRILVPSPRPGESLTVTVMRMIEGQDGVEISDDTGQPIRGQYPGHVITHDQSEERVSNDTLAGLVMVRLETRRRMEREVNRCVLGRKWLEYSSLVF